MPFADEARAGFQARLRRLWRKLAGSGRTGDARRAGEALPGPSGQSAEFDFLEAIGDGPQQQIAAGPRRL
jgi:hypothetical protein